MVFTHEGLQPRAVLSRILRNFHEAGGGGAPGTERFDLVAGGAPALRDVEPAIPIDCHLNAGNRAPLQGIGGGGLFLAGAGGKQEEGGGSSEQDPFHDATLCRVAASAAREHARPR